MTDEKVQLRLVSPCLITPDWDGRIFADLEASFSQPSLRYHCVGHFMFSTDSRDQIISMKSKNWPYHLMNDTFLPYNKEIWPSKKGE